MNLHLINLLSLAWFKIDSSAVFLVIIVQKDMNAFPEAQGCNAVHARFILVQILAIPPLFQIIPGAVSFPSTSHFKTIFFCHPERSEGSSLLKILDSSLRSG
jgi:hypothetical protein